MVSPSRAMVAGLVLLLVAGLQVAAADDKCAKCNIPEDRGGCKCNDACDCKLPNPGGSASPGILERHNLYRSRHWAAPLSWSDDLTRSSQSWANRCEFKHSGPGENLYASSNPASGEELIRAVDSWYNEVNKYDFGNPGFSMSTGHFTQIVWRGTTQIGCAIANCNGLAGFPAGRAFVVCHYASPGNVMGRFNGNVLPASR